MKINQTFVIIILAVLVAGQTYFLFDLHSKNKALEKSHQILDGKLELQKKVNLQKFDSIAEIIHYQNEHLADLDAAYTDLIGMYEILNDKSNENKDRIRNIRDVDSLRSEVANRYLRR